MGATKAGPQATRTQASQDIQGAGVQPEPQRGDGVRGTGPAPAAAPARSGSGTVADVPKAVPAEASDVAAIDELRSIKGLGARSSERLAAVGVTTLAQVAAWSDADIDEIAPRIHVGAERIRREDWVGQAQAATRG